MKRILLVIFCLSISISISGCSTKAADVSAPDNTVTQSEDNDATATEDGITETSSEQSSNPNPKVASIPATEAGLYTAIGKCSELVIDPSEAQSSDPRVADGIAANVANCINDKFPQFYCGPIAMDDGSDGSLGDQVCTWKEYQVQGIRIIMTDEYTSAMQAAGSPYYP
jgi:hypothetical protein